MVKPPRDKEANHKPKVPRPPPIDPTLPRRIVFDPFPANVSIGIDGGDLRPFGPSFRDIELVPGLHRFKFVGAHECCIDEEISLKIEPGEGPVTIEKRLRFRPAMLYVVTETPANVVVDEGRFTGRTRDVIEVAEKAKAQLRIKASAEATEGHGFPEWVEVDAKALKGKFKALPVRSELPSTLNENMIIELYSK